MYNRIIKRYYLIKLFTLALPKKKNSNIAAYYLCKYFIKNSPYGNINIFIKEINKITTIILNTLSIKKLIFICSNKIFLFHNHLDFQKHKFYFLNNKSKFFIQRNINRTKTSFVILYNINPNNKYVSFFKEAKITTIGFINFHNQPNISDYTILLEGRFFSSIFLFNFIFKKLFCYVKN